MLQKNTPVPKTWMIKLLLLVLSVFVINPVGDISGDVMLKKQFYRGCLIIRTEAPDTDWQTYLRNITWSFCSCGSVGRVCCLTNTSTCNVLAFVPITGGYHFSVCLGNSLPGCLDFAGLTHHPVLYQQRKWNEWINNYSAWSLNQGRLTWLLPPTFNWGNFVEEVKADCDI